MNGEIFCKMIDQLLNISLLLLLLFFSQISPPIFFQRWYTLITLNVY